ncbi:MAG: VOC family protein, partial [Balneola sp.]
MNFTPSGLNHITIRVNRIDASKEFYGDILGFEVIRTMGQSMAVYDIGGGDTMVIV